MFFHKEPAVAQLVKWITRPSDCTNINVDADVAKMTAK
jgi:hypothetical protein